MFRNRWASEVNTAQLHQCQSPKNVERLDDYRDGEIARVRQLYIDTFEEPPSSMYYYEMVKALADAGVTVEDITGLNA